MSADTLPAPSPIVQIPNGDAGVTYREVPDWPGYAVGDDGSVWSSWQRHSLGARGGTYSCPSNEWARKRILAHKSGYRYVSLRKNGKQRNVCVHLIVLTAFVGPRPSKRHHGCHDDGDNSNNRRDNLRWDTPESNQADRLSHGTDMRGEKHHKAKISEATAGDIIRRIRAGQRTMTITAETGASRDIVVDIRRRRTWFWLWDKI